MRNRLLVLPALIAAIVSACGGDSGPSGPSGPKVGPPAHLLIQSGGIQVGILGQPASESPTVLVTDASNLPVPGVAVTFSIVSGGGSLSGTTQTTGPTGTASVVWTLGNAFGLNVLQAALGAFPPVSFSANAMAPDAGILAFNQADPAGDTADFSGVKPKAHDLLSMRGDFKRDSLILTLTFAAPVSPASANVGSSLAGFIEIDIDDQVSTGIPPASNSFGASGNLGIDYQILLFQSDPTTVPLLSAAGGTVVPASFSGNTMTIRIPMSQLGNDDGSFDMVGVVGTLDRPTDVVPNTGGISVRRSIGTSSLLGDRITTGSTIVLQQRQTRWGEGRIFQGH